MHDEFCDHWLIAKDRRCSLKWTKIVTLNKDVRTKGALWTVGTWYLCTNHHTLFKKGRKP